MVWPVCSVANLRPIGYKHAALCVVQVAKDGRSRQPEPENQPKSRASSVNSPTDPVAYQALMLQRVCNSCCTGRRGLKPFAQEWSKDRLPACRLSKKGALCRALTESIGDLKLTMSFLASCCRSFQLAGNIWQTGTGEHEVSLM